MTREERELARLLIGDPVVRDAARRAARLVLVVSVAATFVGSLLVLWMSS